MPQNKKILIIEDNKDIAKLLQIRLEMEGYQAITAADGNEGLRLAKSSGVDLIILDLMLPGLPGEEICRQLRKENGPKKLPVIMLSAKDTDADMVLGKVIGADLYMSKPFDIEELLQKIESLLFT